MIGVCQRLSSLQGISPRPDRAWQLRHLKDKKTKKHDQKIRPSSLRSSHSLPSEGGWCFEAHPASARFLTSAWPRIPQLSKSRWKAENFGVLSVDGGVCSSGSVFASIFQISLLSLLNHHGSGRPLVCREKLFIQRAMVHFHDKTKRL